MYCSSIIHLTSSQEARISACAAADNPPTYGKNLCILNFTYRGVTRPYKARVQTRETWRLIYDVLKRDSCGWLRWKYKKRQGERKLIRVHGSKGQKQKKRMVHALSQIVTRNQYRHCSHVCVQSTQYTLHSLP